MIGTDVANRICPNCGNPNYVKFLDDSKLFKFKCINCNHYFNDREVTGMPDRETVMRGLEYCITHYNCQNLRTKDCPYLEWCKPIQNATGNTLMRDALALLKEQEAVEPKWASGIKGADALCGSCMAWLSDHSWGYCPRCGRAVKWE